MIRDSGEDAFPADGDDEEHREIYARFGLAYYLAECVHRGLVNVFAAIPYDKVTGTRPWIAERQERASAMTLGELATHTKPLLPPEIHGPIDWAVQCRNYLAHGFWFELTHEMLRADGRARLVASLTEAADHFEGLDHALDAIVTGHLERLGGVSAEMLRYVAQEVLNRPPGPPVGRRVPRTDERVDVTAAWLVGTTRGPKAVILHDREGLAWQLGEVGLGWSFLRGPSPSWEVFEDLQRHLPAAIVARPKGARPWDYKLHVSTGALLVVSRGGDGIMRFKVRRQPTG